MLLHSDQENKVFKISHLHASGNCWSIKELCYIKNQLNDNETYVGNICVNQFIGIDTGNLFAGLKRIAKDDQANANAKEYHKEFIQAYDSFHINT